MIDKMLLMDKRLTAVYTETGRSLDRFSLGNQIANLSGLFPVTVGVDSLIFTN